MNKMKTTTSHSNGYHQEQLFSLQQQAGLKLEELLKHFNILDSLKKNRRFYVGSCPIHGGDRNNAFNIFHVGNNVIGNWRCFTNNCHEHFQSNLLGFIRAIISSSKYGWRNSAHHDKVCSFNEAISFLAKFCGTKDLSEIAVDYEAYEQRRFVSNTNRLFNNEPNITRRINPSVLRNTLKIPAEYFLHRNYSKEILTKYDVGFCNSPYKEMYMRAVAPIYDNDHEYIIGCSGRSIFDMCPLCLSYHNPSQKCPPEEKRWKYCKWRNNYGFKGEYYLYNFWFAKEHIKRSGVAIIVEGPGDVWRLEQCGIHNSVATFGAHITDKQREILDRSGALSLIILTDPDAAGKQVAKIIKEELSNTYSLYFPKLNTGDIGETNDHFIIDKLVPVFDRIEEGLNL